MCGQRHGWQRFGQMRWLLARPPGRSPDVNTPRSPRTRILVKSKLAAGGGPREPPRQERSAALVDGRCSGPQASACSPPAPTGRESGTAHGAAPGRPGEAGKPRSARQNRWTVYATPGGVTPANDSGHLHVHAGLHWPCSRQLTEAAPLPLRGELRARVLQPEPGVGGLPPSPQRAALVGKEPASGPRRCRAASPGLPRAGPSQRRAGASEGCTNHCHLQLHRCTEQGGGPTLQWKMLVLGPPATWPRVFITEPQFSSLQSGHSGAAPTGEQVTSHALLD